MELLVAVIVIIVRIQGTAEAATAVAAAAAALTSAWFYIHASAATGMLIDETRPTPFYNR